MFKFHIKNFQSVRDASFTLKGFTVLNGDNDIGKSSTYRAINALFNNRQGAGFITQGESLCQVSVEYDDTKITWSKAKKGGGKYEVIRNGEKLTYDKTGKSTPEFISEFGFGALDLKAGKIDPHFSKQREEPFLIAKASSKQVITEFFSELLKFGSLGKSVGKVQKDINVVKKELTSLEVQEDTLELILKDFPDVDASLNAIDALEHKISEYEDIEDSIALLKQYMEYDSRVLEVPELKSKVSKNLNTLVKAFDLIDLIQDYSVLESRCSFELPDIDDSNILILEYLILEISVKNQELPDIDSFSLFDLEYVLASITLKENEKGLRDLEEEISEKQGDFDSYLKELGMCPLCEREVA